MTKFQAFSLLFPNSSIMTGGQNADQFWIITDEADLPEMANIITDFSSAEGDVIGLVNTNLSFGSLELAQDNSDTIIRAFDVDLALLIDVDSSSLSETDFAFV